MNLRSQRERYTILVGSPKYLDGSCGENLPEYAMPTENPEVVIRQAKRSGVFISHPANIESPEYGGHYSVFTRRNRNNKSLSTIQLPMPTNLQNQFGAQYEDSSGLVTELASQFFEGGRTDLAGAMDILGEAGAALGRSTADALTGGARALVEKKIVSPRVPVLFKGMNFREFSFEWNLTAKSQTESDTIKTIIEVFQDGMLPREVDNYTLEFPDEFFMSLHNRGQRNKYLFAMDKSVLTSMQVNYNGQGMPIFFEDTNAPVSIQLSLSFQEVLIPTRQRMQELEGRNTGE